jgi:prephenate dehydrogenase
VTRAVGLRDARVAIVGLGLMGGSLAAALVQSRACRRVVGVARREEAVSLALEMGAVDVGTCNLAEGVAEADIVVLATPVRSIMRLIESIGPLVAPGCLLTDVGSTKEAVVRRMELLPPHVQPVGGHPMCGKESAGLSAAEPGLFAGATYVLTPLGRTSDDAVALAAALVRAVGARPLLLEPSHHDLLAAAVSHLPYILSLGLVAAAESVGDDAVWQLAASGFRDTSRLAASDEAMMLDILLTNRAEVSGMLSRFQHRLAEIVHQLDEDDETGLLATISAAAQRRRRLLQ